MYLLSVSKCFDAAHQLPNYIGECSRLHGHRWKVTATFKFPSIDEDQGMACDLKVLKGELTRCLDDFDHRNLNDYFKNPTAELLAFAVYVFFSQHKDKELRHIYNVSINETPNTTVTYQEDYNE